MSALDDFWEYSLKNKTELVSEYLTSRDFDTNDFEWGYFPKTAESEQLLKTNINQYKDLSIAFNKYNGDIYCKLYDRLIFPIRDIEGNLIAISGRPITDIFDPPKYYNSKYNKKYNLFYLDKAIPAIRKNDFVLVCEGYFATLRLYHTCKIKNVVATCGTLFTRQHLDCLSRYTKNIVFFRDSDNAGQEATGRTLEKFKGINGLNIYSVQLDTTEDDPDDYVIKYGKEKLIEIIKPQIKNNMV